MLARRVIKLKNPAPLPTPTAAALPISQPVVRRLIKVSKFQIPPLPRSDIPLTKAMEAFESIREYYILHKMQIPQSDIKWYYDELAQEKIEYDEFWARCAVTKACMEGTLRGDDDWTIRLAMNAAKQLEKKLPIQESDIGPMPPHGTGEFGAWCRKRKLLKQQKDSAIIAAGGTVPSPKAPKKAAKKPKALEKTL
uniref:Uncharacterized protein n=1 Tax=viral metagenome TaxID=1070528 RepID=A0A6C0AM98_9ZZZZ